MVKRGLEDGGSDPEADLLAKDHSDQAGAFGKSRLHKVGCSAGDWCLAQSGRS